jgi:hypothetical protein
MPPQNLTQRVGPLEQHRRNKLRQGSSPEAQGKRHIAKQHADPSTFGLPGSWKRVVGGAKPGTADAWREQRLQRAMPTKASKGRGSPWGNR